MSNFARYATIVIISILTDTAGAFTEAEMRAIVAVSAARAAVAPDNPLPDPDAPDPVRPPSECDNCIDFNGDGVGDGSIGDGRPVDDCPLCDWNGDGSNDDPKPGTGGRPLNEPRVRRQEFPPAAPAQVEAPLQGVSRTDRIEKEVKPDEALKTVPVPGVSSYLLFSGSAEDYLHLLTDVRVADLIAEQFYVDFRPKLTPGKMTLYASSELVKDKALPVGESITITDSTRGNPLGSASQFLKFLEVVLKEKDNAESE